MKKTIRKAYFTLLEILIVLLILSFGAVLTGVKLKEVFQEQRFASETQMVIDQLRLAQDLMLIMDADVEVKFAYEPETKKVCCSVEVEKLLNPAWAKRVEGKREFSAIRSFRFNDESPDSLIIRFSLGKMSRGQLVLAAAEKKETLEKEHHQNNIALLGYPGPIELKDDLKQDSDNGDESQLLYPKEVYEEIYPEPENNSLKSKKMDQKS